jgi:uncharacterized protein (DUF1919 family)
MATLAAQQQPVARGSPVREPLKVLRRRVAARVMQLRVRCRDFSVISNDCWGGMAYEELSTRYASPFVGLFLVPEDFVTLAAELRESVEDEITFRDRSRHEYINEWRDDIGNAYPIGVLRNGVEIQFLFYANAIDAKKRWERRLARINWSKLRFKLSWHEYPGSDAAVRRFAGLPISAKLILGPNGMGENPHCVTLPDFSTDGTQQYWRGHKAFDVAKYLDTGEIHHTTVSRLCGWLFYWHY